MTTRQAKQAFNRKYNPKYLVVIKGCSKEQSEKITKEIDLSFAKKSFSIYKNNTLTVYTNEKPYRVQSLLIGLGYAIEQTAESPTKSIFVISQN